MDLATQTETYFEQYPPELEQPRPPLWARVLLPPVTDLLFIVFICALTLTSKGTGLLNDADTGWHIRNGEHILRTWSVPHTDYFSYTMAGKPWFAWEWLYDVAAGLIHGRAGLNGIVLLTAAIIAAAYAGLLRSLLSRGVNFAVAVVVTLLCVWASLIHALARPHVLTWLFTVIWVDLLYKYRRGSRRSLYCLPLIMVLWVNIHGGFIVGIALLGLCLGAEFWTWVVSKDELQRLRAAASSKLTGVVLALCIAATFLTPYGYKLHLHIYEYLSNSYFMSVIQEFAPPNFHNPSMKAFELLLLLAILAIARQPKRMEVFDLLLVLFAVYLGLIAARNVPIAGIVLAAAAAPAISECITAAAHNRDLPRKFRGVCSRLEDLSRNMGRVESWLRFHAAAAVAMAFLLAITLHGGFVGSHKLMDAHFSVGQFPVAAVEIVAANGIHDGLLSTDQWGAYLIYQLYPDLKVFVDDRHDFYGEAFIKDFLKFLEVKPGWEEVMEKRRVRWVLWPADAALVSVLKRDSGWKLIYEDRVAALFARR